jgi:DNA-binding winged helix-turn-helix (wHTH) protein/tetratricopeptide (TPR) repeat protein
MTRVGEDREAHGAIVRFGPFALDPERSELQRSGEPVPLEPLALQLLAYLIEHRDRIVPKRELLAQLWGSAASDAALAGALRELRRALGDGHQQRWIRTQRILGYQFAGSLEDGDASRPGERAAPERPRIIGAPRGLSTCFVGRSAELERLEALFEDNTGAWAAICGVAGIGKTELALQLTYRLAQRGSFPAGIFWLDAERPELQEVWGGAIADQYGIAPGPAGTRCAELLRALARRREPLLVVLDNVESWRPEARPGPLPREAHVSLLVTTRQSLGTPFQNLALGLLSPPHDRELVTLLAGRSADPGLDELLEYIRGYVLGLELAGAFLATYPTETPRSYLDELRRNADVERSVADRTRYERTVDEAFRTVWSRLSPALREAWWLASYFEPVPVPPELALACGIDREQQGELRDAHLIQGDPHGYWTMHRLIRAFGRRHGPAPARALERLLAMAPHLLQRNDAAAELEAVSERAFQLAEQTSQSDDALIALDALWYARVFQGSWSGAAEIARMLDNLTAPRGSDAQRLFAHRAWGGVHFYTGNFAAARTRLELGAEACRRELQLRPTVIHLGVFVLAHAGIASAYLGAADRALQWIDEAAQLAERTGEPTARALALYGRIAVHSACREFAAASAAMRDLHATYTAHNLRMFGQIAPHGVWAELIERDALDAADRARLDAAVRELREGETLILVPASFIMLAEVHARCGEREHAWELLEEAARVIETTGERYYEPELWRIRASLAGAPRAAVQDLERGLRIALEQGSRLLALRCATDLVVVSGGVPRRRRRLRELCAEFREGLAQPDLVRARDVLGT